VFAYHLKNARLHKRYFEQLFKNGSQCCCIPANKVLRVDFCESDCRIPIMIQVCGAKYFHKNIAFEIKLQRPVQSTSWEDVLTHLLFLFIYALQLRALGLCVKCSGRGIISKIQWHSHISSFLTLPLLCSPKKFGGAYSRRLVRPSVRPSVRTSHSCPAHNFVVWSRISKLFYRNDHNVETTCRAQLLGPYLKGQGHSMTLQLNLVRPTTLLFEVGFRNNFTEMITILRWCVARNIWVATLKVKVTAWTCSKIVSCP